MKKNLMGLIILSMLGTQMSFASVESLSEEQMLSMKETEISQLNVSNAKEAHEKKSLLTKIKLARQGFKEWKEKNPNHKEIRAEFKEIKKKITTKGTAENLALTKALEKCQDDNSECSSLVKSTLESIYTNSEIPVLAAKKSFSIIPSAYAAGLEIRDCKWEDRGWGASYFAGVYGKDPYCGLTFFGPGLGYVARTNHIQICTGTYNGTNVGLYASANALVGVGAGLTIGESGVCQIFSFNALGVGGFAGLVIIEKFGWGKFF